MNAHGNSPRLACDALNPARPTQAVVAVVVAVLLETRLCRMGRLAGRPTGFKDMLAPATRIGLVLRLEPVALDVESVLGDQVLRLAACPRADRRHITVRRVPGRKRRTWPPFPGPGLEFKRYWPLRMGVTFCAEHAQAAVEAGQHVAAQQRQTRFWPVPARRGCRSPRNAVRNRGPWTELPPHEAFPNAPRHRTHVPFRRRPSGRPCARSNPSSGAGREDAFAASVCDPCRTSRTDRGALVSVECTRRRNSSPAKHLRSARRRPWRAAVFRSQENRFRPSPVRHGMLGVPPAGPCRLPDHCRCEERDPTIRYRGELPEDVAIHVTRARVIRHLENLPDE